MSSKELKEALEAISTMEDYEADITRNLAKQALANHKEVTVEEVAELIEGMEIPIIFNGERSKLILSSFTAQDIAEDIIKLFERV